MSVQKVKSRDIGKIVERELWGRAAGRCQFNGHNKILYRSSVTQEQVNLSQKAHIWSFSVGGSRGQGPHSKDQSQINNIDNLLLFCHECHTKIDKEKDGGRYTAELLQEWKLEHEQRIERVSGIHQDNKSHVVLYGANIGAEKSFLEYNDCAEAMFEQPYYPCENRPVNLSMTSEENDHTSEYWIREQSNLEKIFTRKVEPIIDDDVCKHFSVFSLAPQPLLILLGTLFTDKFDVRPYQLHRNPKGWKWTAEKDDIGISLKEPKEFEHPPVLILSISAKIDHERVTSVLGDKVSVWELTVTTPSNDILQSIDQFALFRAELRKAMERISSKHGFDIPLNIFPAMPVACAVEFGLARQPKACMPWVIFDQNVSLGGFAEAIRIIGGSNGKNK